MKVSIVSTDIIQLISENDADKALITEWRFGKLVEVVNRGLGSVHTSPDSEPQILLTISLRFKEGE